MLCDVLQRFRPITVEKPKVLLPLVNVPLLEYTLEWLALNKVEEVRLCVFVSPCATAVDMRRLCTTAKHARGQHVYKNHSSPSQQLAAVLTGLAVKQRTVGVISAAQLAATDCTDVAASYLLRMAESKANEATPVAGRAAVAAAGAAAAAVAAALPGRIGRTAQFKRCCVASNPVVSLRCKQNHQRSVTAVGKRYCSRPFPHQTSRMRLSLHRMHHTALLTAHLSAPNKPLLLLLTTAAAAAAAADPGVLLCARGPDQGAPC
jgi:hypothetical protein